MLKNLSILKQHFISIVVRRTISVCLLDIELSHYENINNALLCQLKC